MRFAKHSLVMATTFVLGQAAWGGTFTLMTDRDATKYPGPNRLLAPSPGPGFPGTVHDGDRLAGTSDVGATVTYAGLGTPMYAPNHVGAMSFLYRRGSIPAGGANRVPILGTDFLGGPLLDLDGDGAGPRSLVPVADQTPVEIPGSSSHVDLSFDLSSLTVSLTNFDATGTNEGGPSIQPEIATVVVTLAGTSASGMVGAAINPGMDTRVGTLAAHTGPGGTLRGVYRIENLGFELWYDAIDPASSSSDQLGTLQHLGMFRGWLVLRDCGSGQFPALAGQSMGGTAWPSINSANVGQVFNTAVTTFGPTATINNGPTSDQFSAAGNGGIALTGGDIGAYFDTVVTPMLAPTAQSFVYLEAVGIGINNSGDPVFGDTTGYDVVVVASSVEAIPGVVGDVDGDGAVTVLDATELTSILLDPGAFAACEVDRGDVNQDGDTDGRDIAALVSLLI
ncbi:MAG: dockerin type I domain-containing protein [Planctomycetota bacterium]